MTDHFDAVEPKIGTNWGTSRKHVMVGLPSPLWAGSYGDARMTLCGGSILAYDPADEKIPNHIMELDISNIPWCKNCKKRSGL